MDNFGQFGFWAHQNLDAPCGSKSGLVFLDWCDGGRVGGGGEGKRLCNCLMAGIIRRPQTYQPRISLCSAYI